MARYFFHIKDGAELIQDPEGSELATMEDARSQALKSARELWADAIKSGRSLGADAVVIADERGGLTFVPMAEALPIGQGSSFETRCRVSPRGPSASSAPSTVIEQNQRRLSGPPRV